MMRSRPYLAVVSDMDGVLTRTAEVHERAWKEMFDEFLGQQDEQRPFTSEDYRAHVDGKPRYGGVQDFLASRGIELPFGDEGDAPGTHTVCGLGNRKNQLFLKLLERDGVKAFEDSVAALARWKRGGLKLAAISSSRNCRRVLEAAGLDAQFDVVVDGVTAKRHNLGGKPGILREAARRLDVAPEDALVLEDATAGVRAGVAGGFGCVVGVQRNGDGSRLWDAGAHQVVGDVSRLRFPRRLPAALERFEELQRWQGQRKLALFLDFDGTLAPIVDDPKAACISDEMRTALRKLTCPVAIVSGRDRRDVASRVGLDGIFYAGNHGFDISGPEHRHTLPEAEGALGEVDRVEKDLEAALGEHPGVVLERKRYSLAVHYRMVESDAVLEEMHAAVDAAQQRTGLRKRTGKKVIELEPAVEWDKGKALEWIVDVLPLSDVGRPFVVYIGDDETDEDAFAVLRDGVGIRVGEPVAATLADYHLQEPEGVRQMLAALSERGR